MLNDARGQAQRMIELRHPLGVALGQVVVDGHEMDAFAFQGIEVDRQRRHQGLPLPGFHLGDAPAMEDHAADQLHIEMAHIELAARHFPAYGKGFWQNVVEGLARCKPFLEVLGFVGKGLIGKGSQSRLQPVDLLHDRPNGLDFTIVFTAENQIEYLCNHKRMCGEEG